MKNRLQAWFKRFAQRWFPAAMFRPVFLRQQVLAVVLMLAILSVSLAYLLGGQWEWCLVLLAVGCLEWFACYHHWGWMGTLALCFYVFVTGLGVLMGRSPVLMLVGIIAALAAWDLDRFDRLIGPLNTGAVQQIERQHLRRLLVVGGAGLVLGLAAVLLRVKFAFGWAALLGIISVLALGFVARYARR